MSSKEENQDGITVKKSEDFSEWFTQVTQKAELCDMRYNIKGFVVYRPWCVYAMKRMFNIYEHALEKKGHDPVIMPVLIPEKNFNIEAEHVEGFAPEVFWVTEHGDGEKFEERLALRPTSETAFYQMFSHWIRSYQDLPLKTYQSGSVYRYETKATRPFIRSREIIWIEAHDAFATEEEAMNQVLEDMQTTKEVMLDYFGIPFIFFQRPEWDKFPGAVHTYAADALMPSGRVLQLPSTHLLGQKFSKPFDVKFVDNSGKEQYAHITCYGPAISRIYGGMIGIHGDDRGLVLPFDIAPKHIVIVPILFDSSRDNVLKRCVSLRKKLKNYRVFIDSNESKSPGWKFNHWELKGVPIRIEVGPNDIKKNTLVIFRRDKNIKKNIKMSDLLKEVEIIKDEFTQTLIRKAKSYFDGSIINSKTVDESKELIKNEKIVRAAFCSIDTDGKACAEVVEKEVGAAVRGIKVGEEEKPKLPCIICGKSAKHFVYIARSY
ncbi:MAG: proline--tRNA ligase [Nanoarchaeota archaeon]|mgnify:CR=1 FL=1